jgi:hypothetical protein
MTKKKPLLYMHGVAAEFEDAEELKDAAQQARDAGYREIEAYSPYYVEGLADILGHKANILPFVVLIMMLLGAFIGFYMQFWTDVVDYPINVGGRPYFSWQAFFAVTFEMAVLFGGLAAFGYFLFRTALPLPYHPVFNTPNIELASSKRFFLCIRTTDRQFQLQRTKGFLQSLEPTSVSEVLS